MYCSYSGHEFESLCFLEDSLVIVSVISPAVHHDVYITARESNQTKKEATVDHKCMSHLCLHYILCGECNSTNCVYSLNLC